MTKTRSNRWFGLAMLALVFALGIGLAANSAFAGAPATLSQGTAPSREVQLKMPAGYNSYTVDRNTAAPVRMLLGPASPTFLGDLLGSYDVETPTQYSGLVGIQYLDLGGVRKFYVTGRNTAGIKSIHEFDLNGNLLRSVVESPVCGSSSFGWRDGTYNGTNMVFGDECGVHFVDPSTLTSVTNLPLPTGVTVPRALAYNSFNGHYYTANFNSAITEFDGAGAVVTTYPANGLANFGFGFDSVTSGGPYVWSWSQNNTAGSCTAPNNCIRATRLNLSFVTTGVQFDGVPRYPATGGELAGGADVATISGTLSLIAMHQAMSDTVRIYDLTTVGATSTPSNTPPPTATFTPRPPQPTPTCLPQLVVFDRNKQKPGTLVAPAKSAKSKNSFDAIAAKANPGQAEYLTPDSSFALALDDGTSENSIGFGSAGPPATEAPALWLNRFTPSSPLLLPYSLQTISIYWPAQSSGLDSTFITETARLLVYLDADGDGNPGNATLISGGTRFVTVGVTNTFHTYNLSPAIPVTTVGDLYIGFEDFWAEPGNYQPRLFPAAIDTNSGSQVRSWIAGMGAGTSPDINVLSNNTILETIDAAGLPGNWLIRATGDDARSPHCLPTGTPGGLTSTPTLTRTPTNTVTLTPTPTCPPLARMPQTIGPNNPGKPNLVKGNNKGLNRFSSSPATRLLVKSAPARVNPRSPISFQVDDGTIEDSIGFGTTTTETAAIWLNRFSPGSFNLPLTINSISIFWPSDTLAGGSLIGKTTKLFVYSDPDGDNNPANATLAGQATVTIGVTNTFQTYSGLNIPVAALTGDIYLGFEDFWAEPGFTPKLYPAAIDETAPSQVRSWVIAMGSGAPPDTTNLGNNDVIGTIDSFGLPGNWMIRATGNTADRFCPTATPAPAAGIITGHLTWQGIPQPNSRNTLVTGTLTICTGSTPNNFTFHTDASGNFTVTTGLPDGGPYTWVIKGPRHLATRGSVTISGGVGNIGEAGLQRGGDVVTAGTNNNIVNSSDFTALKSNFGQAGDRPSDIDFNGVTNSSDFNILKGNFGQAGAALTCP